MRVTSVEHAFSESHAKEKPVPTPKKASKPKELGRQKDQKTARNKDPKDPKTAAKAKATTPKKMEKPKPKPPPKVTKQVA